MKNIGYSLLTGILFLLSLSSCELIGDIFKAGVWVGILIVVFIIVVIIWLVNRFGRK